MLVRYLSVPATELSDMWLNQKDDIWLNKSFSKRSIKNEIFVTEFPRILQQKDTNWKMKRRNRLHPRKMKRRNRLHPRKMKRRLQFKSNWKFSFKVVLVQKSQRHYHLNPRRDLISDDDIQSTEYEETNLRYLCF
jgi:hypothetical protein